MNESLNVGRTGKRNLLPSKQTQRDYLRELRAAADAGDVLAMGLLVGLAKLEEHNAEAKEQDDRNQRAEVDEQMRLATIVAAHVPEHLWPYLSKELRSDADAVTEKIRELAKQEAEG